MCATIPTYEIQILYSPAPHSGRDFSSFAQQSGEVRGFVYEKETSEPAIYTSVFLQGTTYGALTNLDGFFTISRIKPGTYTLMVTSVGFDTIRQEVIVKGGDLITRKLYLVQSSIEMKEVEVSAESQSKKTDVRISVNKVTPREIRQIPSVGGDPDLAQYLQVVPGVVFSGDQGGQLYIRGGTPIQNKLLLDGMIIYNPFHSIGLYSVFDADIIRGADIYTGGFNAEYGDRISSIMDITTRDGNKNVKPGNSPPTLLLLNYCWKDR
ncbi:MAG: carboxypeptidase-like regulatory domain-containing protein [Bacteroidetes bacterium]|nr:carboxypeptidase-like regulatory domain-containing protein [Bacteroidota bacterium]